MYKCNLSFTNAFIWLLSSKPINPIVIPITHMRKEKNFCLSGLLENT